MEIIASLGEILVIVGAATWAIHWMAADYVFAIGAVLFLIGRLFFKYSKTTNIALRRLIRQQKIGAVMAVISAGMMSFYPYSPTGWLVPFVVFVVFETYTAFRIPAEMKKEN